MKIAGPSLVEQRVHAYGDLVDFPAPKEELLTVAIDDTANTVFITGIARFSCHVCTYTILVSYIHGIVKGTPGNPEVTPLIQEVFCYVAHTHFRFLPVNDDIVGNSRI